MKQGNLKYTLANRIKIAFNKILKSDIHLHQFSTGENNMAKITYLTEI
jgi:hypothetical protein